MAQPIPVPPKFKKGDWIKFSWDDKNRWSYVVLRISYRKYVMRHEGGGINKSYCEDVDRFWQIIPTKTEQYAVDKVLKKYYEV